jgi:hypothetical protein
MRSLDRSVQAAFLEASTYREFLKVWASADAGKKRGAMAQLCRRAGFASRGYLSDVLAGKKGLSQDSLQRLKKAIGLPKPWGQYFELLVWKDQPALRPARLSDSALSEKLMRLRKELDAITESLNLETVAKRAITNPGIFRVYAALGSEETGATLEEIQARTGMAPQVAAKHLSEMRAMGIVFENFGRFFAVAQKADALSLKDKEAVAELIGKVSTDLQKRREQIPQCATNFVFYSAFSVRRSEMPNLKARLQEAILDVLDEFQDDTGEKVEDIFVSLTSRPDSSARAGPASPESMQG